MNTATPTSAPLALRFNAPAAFGSNEELRAIVERMSVLMPTRLAEWQEKPAFIQKARESLDNAFYKTAQLAIFYRLVPSQDIHILPFGNEFVVDMGIEAWRKAADRYCSQQRITYHIHVEEMPLAELKKRRGANYDSEDVGAVAYLWRSDKEAVYQIFGAKESMSRACGIWSKKAKWNKNKNQWDEDSVPAQRTKEDVAKRRAMKAVLKLEFSLDSLLAATPAEIRHNADALEMTIGAEERRTAVNTRPQVQVDEDGVIIIDPKPSRKATQDMEFVVGPEPEEIDEPDIEDMEEPTDGPMDEPESNNGTGDINFNALIARLTGREASFVTWTKQSHLNSNGTATPEQYRYLVGIFNAIAGGDKNAYRTLFGVMIGRHVSGDNRPGIGLCTKLLDWLVKEHKDEVTGAKVPNPAYRQDYVDCVATIWHTIKA